MSAYAALPFDASSPEAAKSQEPRDAAATAAHRAIRGLREASALVEDPKAADLDALLERGDLPRIAGEEPLRELLGRVGAEAELWRALAFRALGQTRWASRAMRVVSILVALAEIALVTLATFGALLGDGAGGTRAALFLAAASLSLLLALAAFALVSQLARRADRDVMRDALARADLAELRVHRIALVLALTKADPGRAVDVIGKLEADARG